MKQPPLTNGNAPASLKPKPAESLGVENLIRTMLKKHKTPFMLIRKSVLEKQFARFKKALPGVTPFLRHNVSPSRIIFANTIKSKEDLITARRRRVRLMTFDNEAELYKIAENFPKAHVIVRIKVANRGSVVQLSLKFGAEPDQAFYLLRKAKSLGLVPKGVSFHVGSQSTNVENYLQALELTANIFREAKENDMPLKIVDIGGGFPIQHFENEIGINFERMASEIRKQMKALFSKQVEFIAEPGRFFAGPSGVLVTQVIGRAFRDNKNFYYLNDGVYQDFSGMVFDHCKYEFKTLRRGPKYMSALAGPTCDSLDILSTSEELPELYAGDVVYAKNIGAYSSASAVPNF
ncbi:MAG: type III PLP-dependent enzyme, partial [Candidatus Omnitrophica bacterium]|nr:type III PLP-dependent enzyme [Candidatus Omnitrophota bacterium]